MTRAFTTWYGMDICHLLSWSPLCSHPLAFRLLAATWDRMIATSTNRKSGVTVHATARRWSGRLPSIALPHIPYSSLLHHDDSSAQEHEPHISHRSEAKGVLPHLFVHAVHLLTSPFAMRAFLFSLMASSSPAPTSHSHAHHRSPGWPLRTAAVSSPVHLVLRSRVPSLAYSFKPVSTTYPKSTSRSPAP